MNKTPYLHVVDMPRMMGGLGAPKPMMFGVLGRTKMDPYTRSLGGLIETTTPGPKPKVTRAASDEPKNTEYHIIGPASKTHINGHHFGQIPYPGAYMAPLGDRI